VTQTGEVVRQREDQYLNIVFFLVPLLSHGNKIKTDKRIKIICGSRIPRDDQYLFGDSLVAISVAGFKGAM